MTTQRQTTRVHGSRIAGASTLTETKPYVYRGTGEDVLEGTYGDLAPYKPASKYRRRSIMPDDLNAPEGHGTYYGYRQHKTNNTPVCEYCRVAAAAYWRERSAIKREKAAALEAGRTRGI